VHAGTERYLHLGVDRQLVAVGGVTDVGLAEPPRVVPLVDHPVGPVAPVGRHRGVRAHPHDQDLVGRPLQREQDRVPLPEREQAARHVGEVSDVDRVEGFRQTVEVDGTDGRVGPGSVHIGRNSRDRRDR
jgi:hypothetical protein